jgi:4-diphosphocytidyl-2-C-methyl-D-erythritol kinase
MCKISWYDDLQFETNDKPGVELVCNGPHWAPEGHDNLVYRACRLLLEAAGGKGVGVKVTLTKNIPAGTGLGSASSDAAAALMGLNRFLKFGLTTSELVPLAVQLGSDVPFFLYGPLALCTGRGEKIKKITQKFCFKAIVVLPDVSIATKRVYGNYSPNISQYETLKARIDTCIAKKNIDFVGHMCANMLAISCYDLYEEIAALESGIKSLGVPHVCLSGSGSAMYCLVTDLRDTDVKHYQSMLREKLNCNSLLVNSNGW